MKIFNFYKVFELTNKHSSYYSLIHFFIYLIFHITKVLFTWGELGKYVK